MAKRDLILKNFWWKLVSLLLAVFTWFSIQLARFRSGQDLVFSNVPVQVLRNPTDATIYRVHPASVEVSAHFESGALKTISERDIQVFVDMIQQSELGTVVRTVLVGAPEGVVVRVEPSAVSVEKIAPQPESISNSLSKP